LCHGSSCGDAGSILIDSQNITMNDGARIHSLTEGGGAGGDVVIDVEESVVFSGEGSSGEVSGLNASSRSAQSNGGNAGHIYVEARDITLNDGAQILSDTLGGGRGGDVRINVEESVTFSGESSARACSGVYASSKSSRSDSGRAGSISVEANDIVLNDGAQITSDTHGGGRSGDIVIDVDESIALIGENSAGAGCGVYANSLSHESYSGNAGSVSIESNNMALNDGGRIASNTNGGGLGGDIEIKAVESATLSGESSNGELSGVYAFSTSPEKFGGNAGHVLIESEYILLDRGVINTSSKGAGHAGEIKLDVARLKLQNGASISSSNASPSPFYAGEAGAISIIADDYVKLLDN
ncbi:MAG: hypothetical protein GY841_20875, partial [FCB group bacterium]|nr:hypothetical protein [FCB group bacterium]